MLTRLPPPPGPAPKSTGDAGALLREAWDAAAPDIINTVLLLCKRGDAPMLKSVLDRVAPLRRTLKISLPALDSVSDVPAIARELITLVAAGTLTPDEASALAKVLDNYVSAVAVAEHEQRLAAIEKSLSESGNA